MYDDLRLLLFNDSAIAGESAGYAMGLVMLGSGSQKALDEMLQYAHETQHEKIIRGLAVGMGFVMYGREEDADELVETLLNDAVRPSTLFCFLCKVLIYKISRIGRGIALWWYPYHFHGLRRDR
jgi:hypothetical protein